MKGILPTTLRIILKTYYSLPAFQAPVHPKRPEISSSSQNKQLETSLAVQPDDMTGKHQDGGYNSLERPQVSEKADKVVAESTSHVDQGGKFVFQAEAGMDLETAQVAARHFVILPIDRQQRKATTRSTDREETTPFRQTSGGTRKQQQ